jgi:hypothetical protein
MSPVLGRVVALATFAALAACSDAPAEAGSEDGGATGASDAGPGDNPPPANDAAVTPDSGQPSGPSGGPGRLLVATSHVPRMIDLKTGATSEVFANRLRWAQSPGHLYQHWDVSPDGKSIVVYHEYGTNAPASEDRLVVYSLSDSATGKALVKTGGAVGEFTRAPCFAAADAVYFLTNGSVWKVDPTADATQTPEKVKDIPGGNALNGPVVWKPDCSGFLSVGYRSGNTNLASDNVAYFGLVEGTLKQLSFHYGNTKGMTLAQSINLPSCGGPNCAIAKNGGTLEKMGFLPNGHVWFDSNRDVWRNDTGANQGDPKVLRADPAANQEFADLAVLTGARARAVTRDGAYTAVVNGQRIEVLDAQGAKVAESSEDFNGANVPGFMRFVD